MVFYSSFFTVNSDSTVNSGVKLKRFISRDFQITYQRGGSYYVSQYDFSTVYVTYVEPQPRAEVIDEQPDKQLPVLGNPIISLYNGNIIGHVDDGRAVVYFDYNVNFKSDNDMILFSSMNGYLSFPEFVTVNKKAQIVNDCGFPVTTLYRIQLEPDLNRFPADRIVTCLGDIKEVDIAGIKFVTYDYYLYKYARKTEDNALYSYVQRLLKSVETNNVNDAEIARKLVEEDDRIRYIKIDPHERKVNVRFSLQINYIRVYDKNGRSYLIKLNTPLVLKGTIDSAFEDLRKPYIDLEGDIPHPNIPDGSTVCTGNITVNTSSVLGIVTTVKSILEILQYPNLDNTSLGFDFLQFLLEKKYITDKDIPHEVQCYYGLIDC